jgi:hypothetical protein
LTPFPSFASVFAQSDLHQANEGNKEFIQVQREIPITAWFSVVCSELRAIAGKNKKKFLTATNRPAPGM